MGVNSKPVVLISGASRGLGKAVALWVARAGGDLALMARSRELLDEVAAEAAKAGAEVEVAAADVADPAACEAFLGRVKARFGRLDALVNNAGVIGPIGPLETTAPADWRYAVEVNLLGPYYLTRAALPALRQSSGRIINIGTGAATQPIPSWSAYCSSKAALLHFSRVVANEEPHLTVVNVAPGVVETEMQATIRRDGPGRMPKQLADYFVSLKTAGQLEPPEVPGKVIAWLALEAPKRWTGAEVSYDDPQLAAQLQTSEVFASL